MSQLKTAFIECPICKFLQETDSASVYNEITLKNTYGAEVVVSSSEVQDVVFCEKCTTAIWPKEYAPKKPNVFSERPKKPRKKTTKKRLTKKKKSVKIDASKDKNEDI
jgi:hypothetical protein|tara:strand:+ start:22423 stop:22746 length:324 start_codon:yes stop_codon:yes gene_type:complete